MIQDVEFPAMLFQIATTNYSKGTKFISCVDNKEVISSGEFKYSKGDYFDCIKSGENMIYFRGQWALITSTVEDLTPSQMLAVIVREHNSDKSDRSFYPPETLPFNVLEIAQTYHKKMLDILIGQWTDEKIDQVYWTYYEEYRAGLKEMRDELLSEI